VRTGDILNTCTGEWGRPVDHDSTTHLKSTLFHRADMLLIGAPMAGPSCRVPGHVFPISAFVVLVGLFFCVVSCIRACFYLVQAYSQKIQKNDAVAKARLPRRGSIFVIVGYSCVGALASRFGPYTAPLLGRCSRLNCRPTRRRRLRPPLISHSWLTCAVRLPLRLHAAPLR